MAGLLYSVNPLVKLLIQEKYRSDRHYVWCSELFDSTAASPYSFASLVPPSSNPRQIYQDLDKACKGKDSHNDKIVKTRTLYQTLAEGWLGAGEITTDQRDEIAHLVTKADFDLWRPLIYIIPRAPVEAKLQLVHPSKRAGHGAEFIIADLLRAEFEIVEF